MYCLDTNIIIDIFKGDLKLKSKVEEINNSGTSIFVTPITLCELYRGAYNHPKSAEKIQEIESIMLNLEILEFNVEACKEFGKSYTILRKSGKITSDFDLIIGVIVKVNNCILVTRNKKDFEYIGIKIEEW